MVDLDAVRNFNEKGFSLLGPSLHWAMRGDFKDKERCKEAEQLVVDGILIKVDAGVYIGYWLPDVYEHIQKDLCEQYGV